MKRINLLPVVFLLTLLSLFITADGYCKTILIEKTMKSLNLLGGGSYVKHEETKFLNNIGDARKIVVKFVGVSHTWAHVKISAGSRTYYDSSTKFNAFTKDIKIEKHGSQDGYYYIYYDGKKDVTDWVRIYIHIGTATGCPWMHYYKGKVEVYTE